MERENVVAAIAEALAIVLKREVPEITEDIRLFEDLHLDSTSILELLMAIEDSVGIEVDPEILDMDDFRTVGTLADYVTASLGVTAA